MIAKVMFLQVSVCPQEGVPGPGAGGSAPGGSARGGGGSVPGEVCSGLVS